MFSGYQRGLWTNSISIIWSLLELVRNANSEVVVSKINMNRAQKFVFINFPGNFDAC